MRKNFAKVRTGNEFHTSVHAIYRLQREPDADFPCLVFWVAECFVLVPRGCGSHLCRFHQYMVIRETGMRSEELARYLAGGFEKVGPQQFPRIIAGIDDLRKRRLGDFFAGTNEVELCPFLEPCLR